MFVFNYVLRFVHADTAVKENQLEKHLPFTTKSGLRIGCMYSPPPQNHMSADAELLQMALLNIEPEFSQRRIAGWVAYALFLVALYTALVVWEIMEAVRARRRGNLPVAKSFVKFSRLM